MKTKSELATALAALSTDDAIRVECVARSLRNILSHGGEYAGLTRLAFEMVSAEVSTELVTRETFDRELRELGERMAAEGKIVIKQLLYEADVNGRANCRFENWPPHLKTDAYAQLGLEPVQMFRRAMVAAEVEAG